MRYSIIKSKCPCLREIDRIDRVGELEWSNPKQVTAHPEFVGHPTKNHSYLVAGNLNMSGILPRYMCMLGNTTGTILI